VLGIQAIEVAGQEGQPAVGLAWPVAEAIPSRIAVGVFRPDERAGQMLLDCRTIRQPDQLTWIGFSLFVLVAR